MIRRTVAIAVPLLVLLALFAGGAPALGAQGSGDNPAVNPPAELQDQYPLHDPAPGRSDPASPTARPDDLPRSIASESGDGRSPAFWLMIALAAGLGVALLVRVVPFVVRRLSSRAVAWDHALARLRRAFADTLIRLRRTFSSILSLPASLHRRLQRLRPVRSRPTAPAAKQAERHRPRRLVSPLTVRLALPLFRHCQHRDAFILRLIGDRFGPVLRPRKRVQFTPHEFAFVNRAQSKEMGLEEGEHGLLLATDEQGKRWTLVGNPELVRGMVKSPPYGEVAGVDITPAKFPVKRQGWPEEWGGIAPDGHHRG